VLVLQTPPEKVRAQSLVCRHCTHRPLVGSQTAPKPQLRAVHLASHAFVLGLQTALLGQSLVSVHATQVLVVVLQRGAVEGQSVSTAHWAHVWLAVLQIRGPRADVQSPDCRHCTQEPVAVSQKGPLIERVQLLLPWHWTHTPTRVSQYGLGAAHCLSDWHSRQVCVATLQVASGVPAQSAGARQRTH
jgi:hypothetical protein